MSFHRLSSIPGFNSMPTPLGKWKGRPFTQVFFNSSDSDNSADPLRRSGYF